MTFQLILIPYRFLTFNYFLRFFSATCPTCAAESLPVRAYMDFQTEIDDMRDNLRFLNEIEELMVQLRTVFEATDNGGGVQNGGGQVGAQPEPLQLVPMRVARLLPIQIRVRGVRRRFYRLQQVRRRVHVRRHINH